MTPFWCGVLVGMFVGAFLGMLALSLCVMAGRKP